VHEGVLRLVAEIDRDPAFTRAAGAGTIAHFVRDHASGA
jgi:hypothetical protein